MAITKIDNQAVDIVTPGNALQDLDKNCNCIGQDFCQLVQAGDSLRFQVDLSVRGSELVQKGDFSTACAVDWTCGAGWTIAAGLASFAAGSTGSMTQSIAIFDNLYYRVIYTIDNYAGGGSGTVLLGGKTVRTFTSADVGTGTTFTDYIFLVSSTGTDIEFTGLSATSYDLDNVSVRLMSTIGLLLTDINTNEIVYSEVDGTSITYGTTVAKAQVSLGVLDGFISVLACYRFDLIDISVDTANLIVNGSFTTGAGWVVVGDWTFPGTVATHAPGIGSFESTLQQSAALNISATDCYTLTFDMTGFVAGLLTANVQLASGGLFPIGTASSIASFSFDFEFIAGTNIVFSTPNDTGDFQIDNVTLKLQDKCKAVVFETECLKLIDDVSCNCGTILMTWTNNENAYGFDYENFSYTQRMRHCAKLYQPSYEKSGKINHLDSDGDREILYSRTTKIERFKLQDMPEYMHDALSIGVEHDTFKIGTVLSPDDTVQYINEQDDYEPKWRNSSLLADVELEMIKDNQNLVNSNC